MFLKTKKAACGDCVWASLIPPDVYKEEPLLEKNMFVMFEGQEPSFPALNFLMKAGQHKLPWFRIH